MHWTMRLSLILWILGVILNVLIIYKILNNTSPKICNETIVEVIVDVRRNYYIHKILGNTHATISN